MLLKYADIVEIVGKDELSERKGDLNHASET